MIKVIKEYKGTLEVTKEFYETFKECCSIDPTRYFMNHVYYDLANTTFVATDGHRMIYHFNDKIILTDSGFFELAKIGKSYKLIPVDCGGTFPNWQRALPDLENYSPVVINDSNKFNLTGNLTKDSKVLCSIILETKMSLNIDFLLKVLKHTLSFSIQQSENEEHALYITIDESTKYIIMPLG